MRIFCLILLAVNLYNKGYELVGSWVLTSHQLLGKLHTQNYFTPIKNKPLNHKSKLDHGSGYNTVNSKDNQVKNITSTSQYLHLT